jgi:hypothetical protein
MDINQANIDRYKFLLTTETCNGKTGSPCHNFAALLQTKSQIQRVPNATRQWFSRVLRKSILVTTGERLSAQRVAPV